MEDISFKECPFCKEKIRKEAVKCRFCGEWLEQIEKAPSSSTETVLTPLPIPEPPETFASPKIENPTTDVPKAKNKISIKQLRWVSGILMCICGLVLFACLAQVPWQQLGQAQKADLVEKLTVSLFRMLFFLGLIIWFDKTKRYRLFTCSIVFTVWTALFTYNFLDARHKAQEKAAVSDRQYVSDINSLQEFSKHGAVGDIPQFKLTGDADNDAVSRAMNNFVSNYIQFYRVANSAMLNLDLSDVFSDSLPTNKSSLELEIDKRIACQHIIYTLATNTISSLQSAETEYDSQNVSMESKQGMRKSFDSLISGYNSLFAAMTKLQYASQSFLQFLDDNFADYQVRDGKILFANEANLQKCAGLIKNVQDANAELQGLQSQASARTDAFKAKYQ